MAKERAARGDKGQHSALNVDLNRNGTDDMVLLALRDRALVLLDVTGAGAAEVRHFDVELGRALVGGQQEQEVMNDIGCLSANTSRSGNVSGDWAETQGFQGPHEIGIELEQCCPAAW